ncbi:MAG TPA: cupin domain-containing protein [Solirubrobacterales bacterium]|nr:cupin domain-containing protein [Solirubrobacterales bacterium]
MATAGDRFKMPDGSVYAVLSSAADNDGAFVEFEFVLPPGCVSPPPHIHAELTEEYEVLEGNFDVMVDGSWTTLAPGQSASVSPGALHTFRNRSGETVRVRNVHRPPGRFEDYIEQICRVTRAAGIKRPRDPRIPIYLSMITLEYPETLAPGRGQERLLLGGLARLGRLLRFSPV